MSNSQRKREAARRFNEERERKARERSEKVNVGTVGHIDHSHASYSKTAMIATVIAHTQFNVPLRTEKSRGKS